MLYHLCITPVRIFFKKPERLAVDFGHMSHQFKRCLLIPCNYIDNFFTQVYTLKSYRVSLDLGCGRVLPFGKTAFSFRLLAQNVRPSYRNEKNRKVHQNHSMQQHLIHKRFGPLFINLEHRYNIRVSINTL